MSPCCPQLVLHHLFLSLPWKKVLGQASFRDPRLAKGFTVGHKPGRTKSDKAGCPLLPWDLQGVKTMFRDTVSSRSLASG